MGIFGEKKKCSVCGKPVGNIGGRQIASGVICSECRKGCSPLIKTIECMTADEISEAISNRTENYAKLNYFSPSATVGNYLHVDRSLNLWCCPVLYGMFGDNPDLFHFDDLLDYKIVEDGGTESKGGLGSAVVGGALFGGAGAIVGSNVGKKVKSTVTKMDVVIQVSYPYISQVEIPLIIQPVERNSLSYKAVCDTANKITSLLDNKLKNKTPDEPVVQQPSPAPAVTSAADELLKYKNLLDIGAITQEEYDKKKSQLLGL